MKLILKHNKFQQIIFKIYSLKTSIYQVITRFKKKIIVINQINKFPQLIKNKKSNQLFILTVENNQ